MSATTPRTSDCRKFSPNIFNKSKCSHCFRQREEHSAAALECNRASRKVSKCGYLFVAPDWDFTNPLYRTKRWQRRWFVLYDDGELTYSVDEHPETVPQACIDMTKVLEVATAEDVTGHMNSIAITAPDRITFVKGTCHEESKWWLNILSAFPKSKGRHKRNATFPGGQATTILQISNSDAKVRNRHNSYHKESLTSVQSTGSAIIENDCRRDLWQCANETGIAAFSKNNKTDNNDIDDDDDDGVETGDDEEEDDVDIDKKENQKANDRTQIGSCTNTGSAQVESSQNIGNDMSNTACPIRDDVRQDEKTIKDLANTITNLSQQQKNRWSTATVSNVLNSHLRQTNLSKTDKISRDETDFVRLPKINQTGQMKISNSRPKSLPLASDSTPSIVSAIVKRIPLVLATTPISPPVEIANSKNDVDIKQKILKNTKSGANLQFQLKHIQRKYSGNKQQSLHEHERGDPDGGCNLDELSSSYLSQNAELRLNSKAEESLNTKKGWLMKQDNRTRDWTKHWFTLNGAALFYYRDPISEERGVLDGVLDVNSLTNILEVNSNKNYAFQLTTWDKQQLILASLSANSRNSWIAVLRNAIGLPSITNKNVGLSQLNESEQSKVIVLAGSTLITKNDSCLAPDESKSEIERDFINAQRNHESATNNNIIKNNRISPVKSIDSSRQNKFISATNGVAQSNVSSSILNSDKLKGNLFSSDDEYRTASESSRRDSMDWTSQLSSLPPTHTTIGSSTSMETNKPERIRPRSLVTQHRFYKRSRSSPPSSRNSSIDNIIAEKPLMNILSEQEEIPSTDKELQYRLSMAEKERDILRDEAKVREQRMTDLLSTLERTEQELNSRIQEMEEIRESLTTQMTNVQRHSDNLVSQLKDEIESSQILVKSLEDRLVRGIDENEVLYKRLREIEGYSPSFGHMQRNKFKRMDSLSDLTQISDIDPYSLERDSLAEEYNELKSRFEKAVNEIRAMKRELRESQNQFDALEISYASLKQDQERSELADRAQLKMMAARIQDLTLKYSSSDRQVRTLKQKLSKSEHRRSLSLKSKDQITVSKELEEKVCELEAKIDEMEKYATEHKSVSPIQQSTVDKMQIKKATRRRSLETQGTNDSLQFMVRVNDLEKRFDTVSLSSSISRSSTPTPTSSTANLPITGKASEHLLERLRCLENVLTTSKDRLEQGLQQLQSLRSTRTRRSVSPITDRKESYRLVERCLSEVVKLIRESCETCIITGSAQHVSCTNTIALPESSPVKKSLSQLEKQLRNKLSDLLMQRRMLRERNELTNQKHLELLAERIAFESVCFGKLHDSIQRAEHPELFKVRQARAEVTETSHLISLLKAKLSGKCVLKPSGTVDILAGVLARRLLLSSYHSTEQVSKSGKMLIDQNILEDLMRQHNEVNVIIKRYKNHAMEALATGLAAETLSYISTNDLVQGAVQEAWRQAQETVNAELVQSEIAHIMLRNAERLEHSLAPSYGYALTPEECVSFEKFADAVHDALRHEMELDVENLSRRYEEAMEKIKRGQWRLHLNEDRKASESRQLLAEFADIMAHKALVDARIAVLRGENVGTSITDNGNDSKIGITALQKYENLFEELSNDLQIGNADDILAEADFEFIYKQQTIDFLTDRQVLSEISIFLGQLEDSLIALQCEATAESTVPRTAISIESLQDVCHKCCDLRQRAQQLLHEVQIKLSTPCQHCLQVREKLCSLQQQHENELLRLQQTHTKDINILLQQVEHQRNALQHIETEKSAIDSDLHKSEELIEERERELVAIKNLLQAKEEELRCQHSDHLKLLQRLHEQENTLQVLGTECDALRLQCQHQEENCTRLVREHTYLQNDLIKEKELCRRSDKRLELLELEHSKQLECLQQAYNEQLLNHCSEFSGSSAAGEENFRKRYQVEIEQLKTLCEKGLAAMQSSHRRIVSDLEEKHKQEIDRLLLDKETALAEETQATLAALDAMRKAHQSEVQREVSRFKQEFLKQFHKNEHTKGTTRAKEEELEELRQEILSFSEKYSTKCVENAALEEKLRVAMQKLRHFQQMQQMEIRNKQFRAHLASEDPTTDAKFVQGLTTSSEDYTLCNDSENTHVQVHALESFSAAAIEDNSDRQQNFLCSKESPNSSQIGQEEYRENAADDAELKKTLTGRLDDSLVDHTTLFNYEPCYKQSNLYIHNRINIEGLKQSTEFSTDPKSSTAAALHGNLSSNSSIPVQKFVSSKPNEENNKKPNYHEKYLQRRSKLKKNISNSGIISALNTKPVEQPKIQSTKSIHVNTFSSLDSNNLGLIEPMQNSKHLVNQKYAKTNNTKNDNISLATDSTSSLSNHIPAVSARTGAANANIKPTEKCAINLNSFADIVRNTTKPARESHITSAFFNEAIAVATFPETAASEGNFGQIVIDDLQPQQQLLTDNSECRDATST